MISAGDIVLVMFLTEAHGFQLDVFNILMETKMSHERERRHERK
jgi:hypothetical protein